MRKQILEKQKKVDTLVESIKDAKIIVLFNYSGMSAQQLYELRSMLKSSGAYCAVVKNSILSHTAKRLNQEALTEYISGPTAITYTIGDPTNPPRTLLKFIENIEDSKKLQIKIGVLENKILTSEQILQLARLGSYNEILREFIVAVNVPILNFIRVLHDTLLNFVLVLGSIAAKKEKG